jgi:PLP dependent protein
MSLDEINSRIAAACKETGRSPGSVSLIAVSKGQSLDRVWHVLDEGHRMFGENRVQDAAVRWPPLRAKYPGLKLHCIGHLQTNKVKEAVQLFDAIETVDSEKLAAALAAEMDRQRRPLPCFIQVNTGEEPQKGGVAPKDFDAFHKFCQKVHLRIEGLMCIPPRGEIPDLHFALLRKIADAHGLKKLSMGMSADFETAIRYGATHVRVGTALFGIKENAKAV